MEILLKHTVEEVNYILQALALRPFAEVAELIAKIKNNAQSQLSVAPAAPAEVPAESEMAA